MSSWRRRLRLMRRYLVFGVVSLLIAWALLLALANQLLPLAAEHPERIAAWLSERAGRPIDFSTSRAYWTRNGPVFVLRELRVGEGEDSLRVADAELLLRVYSGLVPGNPMTELRLKGLQLEVVRERSGRWRVAGLGEGGSGDPGQIEALGELRIQDASLRLVDELSERDIALSGIDLRLRSGGGRLRIGATVPIGQGNPLHLVADIDPAAVQGELYLGGKGLRLDAGSSELSWLGVGLNGGSGDVQVWMDLADGGVREARAEVALDDIGLRGIEPLSMDGLMIEPRLGLDSIGLSAHWSDQGQGDWRLVLGRLRLADAGVEEEFGSMLLRRSPEGLRFSADRMPLQLASGLAALADRLSPEQRGRLYAANPRAIAEDVALLLPGDGMPRGRARLESMQWRGSRGLPGFSGLSGQLLGDGEAWLFDIDSGPGVELDWPGGIRQRETANLVGSLVAFRDGEDWRVAAAPLRIEIEDLGLDVVGGLVLPADSGPGLDLAARFDRFSVLTGTRLLPVGHMPQRTIEWLNRGLIDGSVAGRAVFVGAFTDWPFAGHEGRFQAHALGSDVVLDYHPDWPRGESLSADVLFQNQSLIVQSATAKVLGVTARVRAASIESFRSAVMNLDIAAEADGPTLLELLRATPLQRRYGAHMAGLRVGGEGSVSVQLSLPFARELGEPKVNGVVDLRSSDLREARWRLAFDQASGRIRFNESGFAADGLSVRVDGEVAHLDVAVGSYTAEPALAVSATLRGRLPSSALLDRVAGLDWLKSSVSGAADWQIELGVPSAADAPMALRLRSDLVGAGIDLPAPLDKAVDQALPLELGLQLPLDQGSIDLRVADRMHLVGRWPDQAPFQADILLGPGSASASGSTGLRIRGRTHALDALPWVSMGMGGEGGGAFDLEELDVQTDRLDLLGRGFADTRIGLDRDDEDRWHVRFQGDALQGELQVPKGLGPEYPLMARFERLHWPQAEGPTGGLEAVLPSTLPPIDLRVEDLRYGDAALGSAVLETYPTLEGMHIERFETRSPDLQIDAQGDWNLIGGRERSSFGIRFGGDDLGRMLTALGYDVRVDRGRTEARIEATWPGAPGAFELERLDGTLSLDVNDGRFLDLEPGAGRILGLFSVNEITRRLALDFRDFFETGLAFKTISGSFVLDGGNAFTEDLDINSPSGTIRIRGRTGLKAQDYDQTVEVLPRTGGVLPVVGALAGGPAGAALGVVAQSVLQQPLGQMTRTLYRLSGSWAEPNTDVIERGPARRGAAREERDPQP